MKRILRVIIWAVIGVVLIVALGLAALIAWFNPNNYKTEIAQKVSVMTGRKLSINGEISWSLWPNVGFKITSATLSNPAGFSQPEFAEIASANVSVKLLPLLSRNIEVDTLSLQGLRLTLVQKSPTVNNWTFTTTSTKSKAPTPASSSENQASSANSTQVDLHISQLSISNATVQFIDEMHMRSYQVQNLNLQGNNIGLNEAFPLSMSFLWQSNAPAAKAQVSLSSDATLAVVDGQYSLDNLILNTTTTLIQSDSAKPLVVNATMTGKFVLDLSKQTAVLTPDMQINKQLNVNGRVQLKQLFGAMQYSGTLQAAAASLVDLLKTFNIAPPVFPNKDALSNFALNIGFNGDLTQLAIPNLSATLYKSNMQGNVNFIQFAAPKLSVDLNLNQINVADYANLYGALLPINGMHVQADLNAKAWDKEIFTHTLNGKVFVSVQQATLLGLDIPAMLNGFAKAVNSLFQQGDFGAAFANLQKQFPSFNGPEKTIIPNSGQQTQFTAFSSDSVITNGIMKNSLALSGQQFHMQGNGTVDFTRGSYVDYTLTAALLQDSSSTVSGANNIQVPFRITGTPEALKYGVDMGPIQDQLKTLFIKKVQDSAKQQLQNAAGNLLQGLIQSSQ